MDVSAYARQLRALLPTGAAWNTDNDSVLSKFVLGLAEELARVEGRGVTLIDETDPRTTSELLEEWERILGLPNPCISGAQPLSQRRAAVVARVVSLGGQTPAYFIAVAAALGFTITVTEYHPFTVGGHVNDPILGTAWAYAWQVTAPLNTVTKFSMRGGVGDPLAFWSNQPLECVLSALRPAHTTLIFAYT